MKLFKILLLFVIYKELNKCSVKCKIQCSFDKKIKVKLIEKYNIESQLFE